MPDETEKPAAVVAEQAGQMGFGDEFETEVGSASLNRPPAPGASAALPYRLKKLRLQTFKGFKDFTLHLGQFNVLVGGNNSGKSTLLRAVPLAYELTKLHLARYKGNHAEFFPGRSVPKSLLPVAQLRDLWPGGRLREGNKWIPSKVILEFESGHVLSFGIIGPWNAATSKIAATDLEAMNKIPSEVIAGFLTRPPEFVPASIGILPEEEYRTPARRSALVASGRHNEIVRNYLLELPATEQKAMGELLKQYFDAGVTIPPFDQQQDQFVSAVYSGGEGEHDLYSAGGGFLQIVEVLAFVLRGTPGMVLLDEPDSHLNSSLQHAFIDILERLAVDRRFQVIVATHSKEIINYIDPSRLIPIDRSSKSAEPLKSEAGAVTLLKELGAIDNVDAYQIVKGRSLMVVEGPTDREQIPKFAAKAGFTLFMGPTRVSIVPAHGVDKLSDGVALQFVEQLMGGQVRCFLVRDRDALTGDLVERVCKASARPMYVWPRDCIESYLVVPQAIHRILVEELKANAPKVEDVAKLCEDVTLSLKQHTFDRVAARISNMAWKFDHKRLEATDVNPPARQEMDQVWDQEQNPPALASGKELLARIRTEVQKRWKVSFGNARIIEAMTPEEVHPDIKAMLAEAQKVLLKP